MSSISDPTPRRGRRDNGLDASAYSPIRDVDPRVGEHLLDVLKVAGIAAYLEPTSDVDSYTRAVSLPSPPTDRLWVDREARPDARALVDEHAEDAVAPDPRLDEQAIWASIVAGYERTSDAPVPPWPSSEDVEPRAEPPAPAPPPPPRPTRRERMADRDPQEHYLPPPPPPVPQLSRHAIYALLLIAAGATLLITPGVIGLGADPGFVLGVLGIVGGVGMLVYRMRERPPFDDGPDDGAVV